MSRAAASILALSREATGAQSNIIWGVALLVVIESMVIASLVVSYFYLRVYHAAWPPPGIPLPEIGWPTVGTAILAASVVPVALASRAIARGSRGPLLAGLALALTLLGAYLAISVRSLGEKPYTFRANAYASVVWTLDGYQLMHATALSLLGVAMLVLSARGHFTAERRAGLQAAAVYWYFTAASGLVIHATVYLAPRVLGGT